MTWRDHVEHKWFLSRQGRVRDRGNRVHREDRGGKVATVSEGEGGRWMIVEFGKYSRECSFGTFLLLVSSTEQVKSSKSYCWCARRRTHCQSKGSRIYARVLWVCVGQVVTQKSDHGLFDWCWLVLITWNEITNDASNCVKGPTWNLKNDPKSPCLWRTAMNSKCVVLHNQNLSQTTSFPPSTGSVRTVKSFTKLHNWATCWRKRRGAHEGLLRYEYLKHLPKPMLRVRTWTEVVEKSANVDTFYLNDFLTCECKLVWCKRTLLLK